MVQMARLFHAIERLYYQGLFLDGTNMRKMLQSLLMDSHRAMQTSRCIVAGCRWPRLEDHGEATRKSSTYQKYPLDPLPDLDPTLLAAPEALRMSSSREENDGDDPNPLGFQSRPHTVDFNLARDGACIANQICGSGYLQP